jgi:ABC-type Mn2+/Zn2+ transport system permease subunit
VGIGCGVIGVILILKGMSFLSDGIAHSSFAGGALAILLGINSLLTIFLFGMGAALFVGVINEKREGLREDTPVGVMFSFSMALAVLFVGMMDRYSVNIPSLLFGSALTISQESFIALVSITVIILVLFFLVKKELLFITFDEEMALVSGIPVKVLNYLFLVLISGIITVSIKAIGTLLVVAMIIIPASAAYQWTYNTNRMIFLSASFGALASFIGLIISYIYDLPTGATIVLSVVVIFMISFVISPKRRAHTFITQKDQEQHQRECQYCKNAAEKCPFCIEEAVKPIIDRYNVINHQDHPHDQIDDHEHQYPDRKYHRIHDHHPHDQGDEHEHAYSDK